MGTFVCCACPHTLNTSVRSFVNSSDSKFPVHPYRRMNGKPPTTSVTKIEAKSANLMY